VAGAVTPARQGFRLAYALLGLAVAGAIAALVLLVANPVDGGRPWSSWKPQGHGLAAAEQIAQEIGTRYRLPSGDQLVGVLAQPPQVGQDVRVSVVAIGSTQPDQDIKVFRTGSTVVYILCGIGGDQCEIPKGTPSQERALLLRREALELALNTFKYVKDKDAVLAIFPPPKGQSPSTAVYLRRDDFTDELSRPLGDTLLATERITPSELIPAEAAIVRRLTLSDPIKERYSGLYRFQFEQAPDGTAYVALAPM